MAKSLAFGKALTERRRNGERVGLLVIALHDWKAGLWFEGRPEVSRVVLPDELEVAAADWTVCLAVDCLLCGSANDEVFYAACDAVQRAGAASVWGEFENGISLLEPGYSRWLATEGPFPIERLGGVLRQHRQVMMLLRLGFYGSRIFDDARMAVLQSVHEEAA